MQAPSVIGVDLGGTKILAGVVSAEGTIERQRETPTPLESQDALLAALEGAIRELLSDAVVAVGVGLPSPIVHATGHVVRAVNIPLADVDVRTWLAGRLGLPVAIENDANAATYAEFRAGAGRDATTMVMLTLGTGCGGGVILDGALYRGWAEFGHMVIEFEGLPCQGACTGRGHLEAYVSGTAATKLAQEAFGPAVDAHRLVRLANEGNARAQEILDGIGRRLGAGIETLVNAFDPELVVVGGGFAAAGEWILRPAAEVVRREALPPASERVRIVRAQLGTEAGLIGAGLLAFEAAG